jgi:hypothetical protein
VGLGLRALANSIIQPVNPDVPVTVSISTGWTSNPDGTRTPTYELFNAMAQVQALSFRDIQQIAGLNLQGTRKAIYLEGEVDGLQRSTNQGGDLITFPDGSIWLVAMVLEQWANEDWCKVAATLQNNA